MNKSTGFIFLLFYVIAVGTGSFLQKLVMNKVTPYQLEVLTAIGMFVVALPALFLVQKNLHVPLTASPLAWLVGLLFALGSLFYVLAVSKLPVTVAAPLSVGYIAVAAILSVLFLKEPITMMKGLGILLVLAGAALLSR